MTLKQAVRRELRVVLSLKTQSVRFRIGKWVAIIAISLYLWRTSHFWWWVAGAVAVGLAVHFIWRWRTRGWTQPWGGWDDTETANRE